MLLCVELSKWVGTREPIRPIASLGWVENILQISMWVDF